MKKELKVKADFLIGDIVYVKTDVTQSPHQIVEIVLKERDTLYGASSYTDIFWFHGFQLTSDPNKMLEIEGKFDSSDEEE
jgi:hypothetical protein